jgi:hypothetical protein
MACDVFPKRAGNTGFPDFAFLRQVGNCALQAKTAPGRKDVNAHKNSRLGVYLSHRPASELEILAKFEISNCCQTR